MVYDEIIDTERKKEETKQATKRKEKQRKAHRMLIVDHNKLCPTIKNFEITTYMIKKSWGGLDTPLGNGKPLYLF